MPSKPKTPASAKRKAANRAEEEGDGDVEMKAPASARKGTAAPASSSKKQPNQAEKRKATIDDESGAESGAEESGARPQRNSAGAEQDVGVEETDEEGLGAAVVEKEAPELSRLLEGIVSQVDVVKQQTSKLQAQLQRGDLPTSKGISFLEVWWSRRGRQGKVEGGKREGGGKRGNPFACMLTISPSHPPILPSSLPLSCHFNG